MYKVKHMYNMLFELILYGRQSKLLWWGCWSSVSALKHILLYSGSLIKAFYDLLDGEMTLQGLSNKLTGNHISKTIKAIYYRYWLSPFVVLSYCMISFTHQAVYCCRVHVIHCIRNLAIIPHYGLILKLLQPHKSKNHLPAIFEFANISIHIITVNDVFSRDH